MLVQLTSLHFPASVKNDGMLSFPEQKLQQFVFLQIYQSRAIAATYRKRKA